MAEKKRSNVRDYLVYLAVRIVICVIQALPFEIACRIGRFLGWVAYQVDRRHRVVAQENLEKAFPGRYTVAEIDVIVRSVYCHFLTVLMEIIFLPRRLHINNWKQFLHINDGAAIVDALLCGRPLLLVTGHFGNWEMAGYSLAMFGVTSHAIARPIDNPYLDDLMRRFRESTGQKLLAKHGDFGKMQMILDQGGVLATLADQDAGQRGVFVEFFGRPASTHKAVALLAIEHKVLMAVAGAYRVGGSYHMVVADLIHPEEYSGNPQAVKLLTQRFTTALETLVRKAPEQYFWVHRRWKHQPLPFGRRTWRQVA
jgi:Kdo2-lipid IVA lauroyltransferase/acyltransferase